MDIETAATPVAARAARTAAPEADGTTRAMFLSSASAFPMLRGPMVAYSPEDDAGIAAPAGGDGGEDAEDSVERDDLATDDVDRQPGEDDDAEEGDGLEEVEFEGKKYKLPNEVKRGLLRQVDYSQKTMAHAEQVKAWEAQRTQQAESLTALRGEVGKVHALQERIEAYKAIPWDQLREENPDEWRYHSDRYSAAREELKTAEAALEEKQTALRDQERQEDATRIRETEAALADPETGIKGWGAQLFQELVGFAGTHGISPADLRQASVGEWKILHLASLGAKTQQQQRQVQRHQQAQQTRPAAPVKASAPTGGTNDKLSTDEWMRRRNAQTRKA